MCYAWVPGQQEKRDIVYAFRNVDRFQTALREACERAEVASRHLLVEDNELNAEITIEILQETGLQVEHVWDGADHCHDGQCLCRGCAGR